MNENNENENKNNNFSVEPMRSLILEEPRDQSKNIPVQEPVINEESQFQQSSISQEQIPDEEFTRKKENKKIRLTAIISLAVLLVVGGLYLFYNFFLMNEERIIKNETKKVFAFITEKVNKLEKNTFNYDLEKDSIGVEGRLNISSDYKGEDFDLTKLGNYNITYNGAIDKKNNKLSGSIALNKSNNKVLSSDVYMQGKDMLVKLNELFDKTLKRTSDEELKNIGITESLKYNNIKNIINKTEEITLNTIDKRQLSKKLVQKKINNKKAYYMEVRYKLDVNKYKANLIEGYLEDDKILKLLAEVSGESTKDMKEELEDYKKEIEKSTSENTFVDVVLYMDKIMGTVKEVDFIEKDNKDEKVINKIIIYKNNDIYTFELENNDKMEKIGTYDLSKKELTLTSKDDYSKTNIVLTEVNDNTINISFNTKSESLFNVSLSAKINNKKLSNGQKINATVNINYKQAEENIKAKVTNTTTITKGKKPAELKNDNYVEVESLTEEQMNSIYQKATSILESVLKDFMINPIEIPDIDQDF